MALSADEITMPLADKAAYTTLIVQQLGDIQTEQYPSGILAATIDALWSLNEGQAATDYLRYLYTKQSAIETLQGACREQVTISGNDRTIQLSDKIRNLQTLYTNTAQAIETEETKAERRATSRGQPTIGSIKQAAPLAALDPRVLGV